MRNEKSANYFCPCDCFYWFGADDCVVAFYLVKNQNDGGNEMAIEQEKAKEIRQNLRWVFAHACEVQKLSTKLLLDYDALTSAARGDKNSCDLFSIDVFLHDGKLRSLMNQAKAAEEAMGAVFQILEAEVEANNTTLTEYVSTVHDAAAE